MHNRLYKELFIEEFSQSEFKKQAIEENDDHIQIGEEEPDQSITVIPKSVYNISGEKAVEMIMPCDFEESVGEYELEWEYVSTPMTLEEKIEEKVEDKIDEIMEKMEEQLEKMSEKICEKIEEETRKIMKMLKKRRIKEEKTQKSRLKRRKI